MRSLFLVSLLLVGFAATVRPADAADVRMYIRHEVADYVVWRRAYNAFDATRRKLGVIGQAVFQDRRQGQGLRIVTGPEDDDGESRRQGHPANLVHYQRRQVACRSSSLQDGWSDVSAVARRAKAEAIPIILQAEDGFREGLDPSSAC